MDLSVSWGLGRPGWSFSQAGCGDDTLLGLGTIRTCGMRGLRPNPGGTCG